MLAVRGPSQAPHSAHGAGANHVRGKQNRKAIWVLLHGALAGLWWCALSYRSQNDVDVQSRLQNPLDNAVLLVRQDGTHRTLSA